MYTKGEAAQLRQGFWTAFGQYMLPVLSAEGEKVGWINYKTGIKDLYFRMDADAKGAHIAIRMQQSDLSVQAQFFQQFVALKGVLQEHLGEEWEWALHGKDESGKTVSSISKTLPSVSVFNKKDWPALISFFKPRIIALDEFWSSAQCSFQSLG